MYGSVGFRREGRDGGYRGRLADGRAPAVDGTARPGADHLGRSHSSWSAAGGAASRTDLGRPPWLGGCPWRSRRAGGGGGGGAGRPDRHGGAGAATEAG